MNSLFFSHATPFNVNPPYGKNPLRLSTFQQPKCVIGAYLLILNSVWDKSTNQKNKRLHMQFYVSTIPKLSLGLD